MTEFNALLNIELGVCIEEMIIAHILWTDDLILMSNTGGLATPIKWVNQILLKNFLVVNTVNTKSMTIGDTTALHQWPLLLTWFNFNLSMDK